MYRVRGSQTVYPTLPSALEELQLAHAERLEFTRYGAEEGDLAAGVPHVVVRANGGVVAILDREKTQP